MRVTMQEKRKAAAILAPQYQKAGMKERAQAHVLTEYCWDRIAVEYEMLYMNLLANPSLKEARPL